VNAKRRFASSPLPGYRASLGNSAAIGPFSVMIAITITPAAYQAIKASLVPRIDGSTPG
jgi:hypothetical protein